MKLKYIKIYKLRKGALDDVLWADSADVNVGLSLAAKAGPTGQSLLELPLVGDQLLYSNIHPHTLGSPDISTILERHSVNFKIKKAS